MKIEKQREQFKPVTITIETENEAKMLRAMVHTMVTPPDLSRAAPVPMVEAANFLSALAQALGHA